MRTLLFVHGGVVSGDQPVAHFLLRLQAAVEYYKNHRSNEDITFLVSGRWTSVTEPFVLTEAEVGKRWILERISAAVVIKEDISVELIGNYAFSKPLIAAMKPDKAVIFSSLLLQPRNMIIAGRVFGNAIYHEIQLITDDKSDNTVLLERELHAVTLFQNLFGSIPNGDDAAFRDTLLYKTPYYFKNLIDDKTYFDTYWEGGFDHYLNSRAVRSQLS